MATYYYCYVANFVLVNIVLEEKSEVVATKFYNTPKFSYSRLGSPRAKRRPGGPGVRWWWAGIMLLLAMIAGSGCVENEQARSDWEWQQMNPSYRPTAPPPPSPQWGFFGAPDF